MGTRCTVYASTKDQSNGTLRINIRDKTYGEMSDHRSCISCIYYVSEVPSHDFCCAYVERRNMIFFANDLIRFYKIFKNTGY